MVVDLIWLRQVRFWFKVGQTEVRGLLGNKLKLDPNLLRDRYEREQRPDLSNEHRHDLTLKLWMDLFSPQAPSPNEHQN
ncbi:MAG: hypothetical protein DMG51_17045 [Acidobacteria bacterium]|nr:MAG: hypothetical protein DMG51_17045 [Acidobacteriota bacterium]